MNEKIYPDSGVELKPFTAKNYDWLMNVISFGFYKSFIAKAVDDMGIQPGDKILDLGCGTGRNAALMAKHLSDEGRITGMDVSAIMERQFKEKFKDDHRVSFKRQRADIPFDLGEKYDKILISFVIHGFPHEVRRKVLENVTNHLKPGGTFLMLDFAEFDMDKMPFHHRLVFKSIECKYAFDFIDRDWKKILGDYGFANFRGKYYIRRYVRLLKATKKL